MNKKILFGLAAAAAVVLAVITYYSNPPATVGTEATIGAAQRAQAPQINPSDVKLGDTSAQDILQTETFDAIMKDESVRTALMDAELRGRLQDAELRGALQDDAVRGALASPELIRRLADPGFARSLEDPAAMKKLMEDSNLRVMLNKRALADALRGAEFRLSLIRHARAFSSDAMMRAMKDRGFSAALNSPRFAADLAGRK